MRVLRSGFVTLVGRPNVGKSSLVNAFFGRKVLIVSDKPQTTRNKISCIYTDDDCQIVFTDTPGIHKPIHRLGEFMVKVAIQAMKGCDLILFVVDASKGYSEPEKRICDLLRRSNTNTFLVVNKIDLVKDSKEIERIVHNECNLFSKSFFTSVVQNQGVVELFEAIKAAMPEGPMYFPKEMLTDRPISFQAAELIREKVLLLTRDEVPHCVAVIVDEVTEKENLLYIAATIYVERDSQKGILIGKNGSMIKQIGTLARMEIESIADRKVYLDLHVKVKKNWRDKDFIILNEIGMKDEIDQGG